VLLQQSSMPYRQSNFTFTVDRTVDYEIIWKRALKIVNKITLKIIFSHCFLVLNFYKNIKNLIQPLKIWFTSFCSINNTTLFIFNNYEIKKIIIYVGLMFFYKKYFEEKKKAM
jgi:hypothetical protein